MTKEQALAILTQLAAAYRGTLAEHQKIQEALKEISK